MICLHDFCAEVLFTADVEVTHYSRQTRDTQYRDTRTRDRRSDPFRRLEDFQVDRGGCLRACAAAGAGTSHVVALDDEPGKARNQGERSIWLGTAPHGSLHS